MRAAQNARLFLCPLNIAITARLTRTDIMKTHAFSVSMLFVGVLVIAQPASAQFNLPRELPQVLDVLKGLTEQRKPAPAPAPTAPAPTAPAPAPATAGENQPGVPMTQAQPAAAENCRSKGATGYHLDVIETTKKEAANYTPGARSYYVSELNDRKNIYLEVALSASRRGNYHAGTKDPNIIKCYNDALDELAVVARKTLPSFRPTGYTNRNAAEERVLQSAVDLVGDKVLGGGLSSATWKIETRSNGIPSARYKHGMLHVRRGGDDSGFCWILYVNVVQPYAGGGTYAGSEGRYISRTLAGCP